MARTPSDAAYFEMFARERAARAAKQAHVDALFAAGKQWRVVYGEPMPVRKACDMLGVDLEDNDNSEARALAAAPLALVWERVDSIDNRLLLAPVAGGEWVAVQAYHHECGDERCGGHSEDWAHGRYGQRVLRLLASRALETRPMELALPHLRADVAQHFAAECESHGWSDKCRPTTRAHARGAAAGR